MSVFSLSVAIILVETDDPKKNVPRSAEVVQFGEVPAVIALF